MPVLLKRNRPRPGYRDGAPSNAEFESAMRQMASQMRRVTSALLVARFEPDAWFEAQAAAIMQGHAVAWRLGRQRGGDLRLDSPDDFIAVRQIADRQAEYLDNFWAKIADGDYFADDGSLKEAAINQRTDAYARATRGTANTAFVGVQKPDEELIWELGFAEHCQSCIDASKREWTAADAYMHPGDGSTECLTNCKCRWRVMRTGLTGFDPVQLGASPANAPDDLFSPQLVGAI